MKKSLIVCLVVAVLASVRLHAADTVYYSVVKNGQFAGRHLRWKDSPTEYGYFIEFNDRGRGPALLSRITVNSLGLLSSHYITGLNYFKIPVNESFEVRNGKAYWKNNFEKGSAPFSNEIYVGLNSIEGEIELMLNILRNTGRKSTQVFPGGSREIKKIATYRLQGTTNRITPLDLVAISGAGLEPVYRWVHQDNRLFASVNNFISIIEAGNEGLIDTLLSIQHQYESQFFLKLAKELTKKPGGIAIKNVNLFEADSGRLGYNRTVLVKGDSIEKVGPDAAVTIPAGYTVIDGTGKFLMPGLWEMHGHFTRSDGPFMLAQGVTNLRDMGNDNRELQRMKSAIRADSLLGPEISVMSGFIDMEGDMAAPTGAIIGSLEQGYTAIESYHKQGCQQIKLYSSLHPDWVQPLAEKAHELGMRVCGHVPAHMLAHQAVLSGYDEITHINMIMLNFFGDTVDTRDMSRFFVPGRYGHRVAVNTPEFRELLKILKEKATVIDPTMGVFERLYTYMPGKINAEYAPLADFLPAEVKRHQMEGGYIDKDSIADQYRRSYAQMKKVLKAVYDNGNIILAGTDGGILQHELEIYSEAGIPNRDVLRTATYWPAKVTGNLEKAGTIATGKVANMILIDGNPLQQMKDIRNILLTIKAGRIYEPASIYAAYGWGYYK